MFTRSLALVAILLTALTSMMAWRWSEQFELPAAVGQQSENRQLVREYYANLNVFLSTGEIEPLASMFAADSNAEALPGCGRFEMETRWRGLKATYPDLSVWIRDQVFAGEEIIADIDLESTDGVIPDWLPLAASETPGHAVERFVTSGEEIVDFRSTMQPSLSLEITGPDPASHVNRDSSLVIVRLEFAPGQRTYERLPGPGSLLVTDGALELVTDPTHFIRLVRESSSNAAEPIQILRPGDAATGAMGDLVVRNSGQSPASALYVSLQPRVTELGGGTESFEHMPVGDPSAETSLSSTLVETGDDAAPGWGELHAAIVLSDEPIGEMEGVAATLLRGPLDTGGGCRDGRSMYLIAAYIPTP